MSDTDTSAIEDFRQLLEQLAREQGDLETTIGNLQWRLRVNLRKQNLLSELLDGEGKVIDVAI